MDKQIFIDYVRRLYNLEGTKYYAAKRETTFYFREGYYKTSITIPDNEIMNKDAVQIISKINIIINDYRIDALKEIINRENWNKDNFS